MDPLYGVEFIQQKNFKQNNLPGILNYKFKSQKKPKKNLFKLRIISYILVGLIFFVSINFHLTVKYSLDKQDIDIISFISPILYFIAVIFYELGIFNKKKSKNLKIFALFWFCLEFIKTHFDSMIITFLKEEKNWVFLYFFAMISEYIILFSIENNNLFFSKKNFIILFFMVVVYLTFYFLNSEYLVYNTMYCCFKILTFINKMVNDKDNVSEKKLNLIESCFLVAIVITISFYWHVLLIHINEIKNGLKEKTIVLENLIVLEN